MSGDVVPVRLNVGARQLAGGATRSGEWWTLQAAAFPEITVMGKDFRKLKSDLEKKLRRHCEAVEERRRNRT